MSDLWFVGKMHHISSTWSIIVPYSEKTMFIYTHIYTCTCTFLQLLFVKYDLYIRNMCAILVQLLLRGLEVTIIAYKLCWLLCLQVQ